MRSHHARFLIEYPNPQTSDVYCLDVTLSSADLRSYIQTAGPRIISRDHPIYVTVNGYDRDSRELWEIPEVVGLCRRAIDTGLISLMSPNIAKRNERLWGAWDVYATAERLIRPARHREGIAGEVMVNRSTVETFFNEVLMTANEHCDAVIRGANLAGAAGSP